MKAPSTKERSRWNPPPTRKNRVDGRLYIVGTPIGNLRDISFRAVDILKSADLIACEDTRHTKLLLDEYSIGTPTTSYHKFNIKQKTGYIIGRIKDGKTVALVSDAGMPGISDPGQELVKAAVDAGIKIEVIPGPSASISALSVSGLMTDRFIFEGFLPAKTSERRERLMSLKREERTMIFYEAPHRILRTLNDIKDVLGDRPASIARELTKKFEELSRGKISELMEKFSRIRPKGEFVVVVGGNVEMLESGVPEGAVSMVEELMKVGLPKSEAVRIVSAGLNVSKNELYRLTLKV